MRLKKKRKRHTNKTECSSRDRNGEENGDWSGNEDWIGDGNGNENGKRRGEESRRSPHAASPL